MQTVIQHVIKDPETNLDYCIPCRLYGDGCEVMRAQVATDFP